MRTREPDREASATLMKGRQTPWEKTGTPTGRNSWGTGSQQNQARGGGVG